MGEAILTKDQILFLEEFKKNSVLSAVFYLTGGTALAEFYLKHRYSDDLDFFTSDNFPQIEVEGFAQKIKSRLSAHDATYKKLYDRRIFYFHFDDGRDDLKIEFTHYPFKQLEQPKNINGILVDSLKDISANKLMAMIDRIEPKDFFDLYWIVKEHFSFTVIRQDAEKKFGLKIDELTLGGEFAKVRNLALPIKKIREVSDEELRHFFAEQSVLLRKNVLSEDELQQNKT